jgi:hypothetical protein
MGTCRSDCAWRKRVFERGGHAGEKNLMECGIEFDEIH